MLFKFLLRKYGTKNLSFLNFLMELFFYIIDTWYKILPISHKEDSVDRIPLFFEPKLEYNMFSLFHRQKQSFLAVFALLQTIKFYFRLNQDPK